MGDQLMSAVDALAKKAENATTGAEALQFAEAANNLMNVAVGKTHLASK